MYRRNFCKLGAATVGALAITKPVGAAGLFTKTSAKKWAVVYGSQCGSTREYANAINEGLGGIADVIDIATATPKVDDYEFFIIGGWRNGSKIQPNGITTFITENKNVLKDKIKGLFAVVGNQGKAVIDDSITSFLNKTLVTPAGVSEKLGKIFFGRAGECSGFPGVSYDNVKPEEGAAFGKKIIADSTGIINPAYGSYRGLGLSHRMDFSGRTSSVNYTVPGTADVLLTVCSITGQRLMTLVSRQQNAGSYQVPWNSGNLAPGYYLYRLQVGSTVETRAIQLVN